MLQARAGTTNLGTEECFQPQSDFCDLCRTTGNISTFLLHLISKVWKCVKIKKSWSFETGVEPCGERTFSNVSMACVTPHPDIENYVWQGGVKEIIGTWTKVVLYLSYLLGHVNWRRIWSIHLSWHIYSDLWVNWDYVLMEATGFLLPSFQNS